MIAQGISAFRNKRVLLLQGPLGPFFQRLANDLAAAGAHVFKINFNGGDWLFYRQNAIHFKGDIEAWPAFFEEVLAVLDIDTVMLFGDCRIYHRMAHAIARERGLEVGVFEEGYFRPNHVTFERDGVNGYSPLPKAPIYYMNRVPAKQARTDAVGNTFWHGAMWACLYYLAAHLLRPVFPAYRHHRPLSVLEAGPWVRSLWRKLFYAVKERGAKRALLGPLDKKYFLVPLQVHNDAQIRFHSEFGSVPEFIRHAVSSFARHAPSDATLVLKHHPMDRGHSDYSGLLRELGKEFKLGKRLMYVHDLHLPTLLQHARGVVLVNSTVGLSALFHHAPLKVCGAAIYNLQGLTYQNHLDSFWQEANPALINKVLFDRFRTHVIAHTQLNGSFYRRLPIPGSATGMHWREAWIAADQTKNNEILSGGLPQNQSETGNRKAIG